MTQVDVVVVGGGATGAGVLRDAALRGFRTVLFERGELAGGTTLRQHGVLHSGARYAVSDPEAARECNEENRILRRVASSVLVDTGGLVVSTPHDDPSYIIHFRAACEAAGIAAHEIGAEEAMRLEAALTRQVRAAFYVPDAYCDAKALVRATVRSVQHGGAEVRTHHRVIGFERGAHRITGVRVRDEQTGEEESIGCDAVVNAAGAWAGTIAAFAGISIPMSPDKGSMLVLGTRLSSHILHRCHLPGDGDIIVPIGTTSVVGTTSVRVADPDTPEVEGWEIDLLLREGDRLVPGLSRCVQIGAYAGVRPLLGMSADGREGGRGFALIDHGARDGVENLLTIVSGKLTTHRLMAEMTVDAVCRALGVQRVCTTADIPLA